MDSSFFAQCVPTHQLMKQMNQPGAIDHLYVICNWNVGALPSDRLYLQKACIRDKGRTSVLIGLNSRQLVIYVSHRRGIMQWIHRNTLSILLIDYIDLLVSDNGDCTLMYVYLSNNGHCICVYLCVWIVWT